ncbi:MULTISPECIES: carbon-nitrogen hydrolase family protein [unclassified Oceanobacter]|uniref:carbon-nitrogen hydrolase family protein n=2 Tax=Gammaproteobacteria TaxID=1236 RepID=UPI0026E171C8|nr:MULTISPECIES: carbon-nitrogen hydrolase family protein [unclassified Oceanobacter]MDO6682659.1 carbon-nitrogen hydrolase family protein [Oceanobacter sp. 5_MG-2023]MDP2609132.1 carbon-nitrogen hydrolase family protein [Oceanobacter sp. 1_MG-2023]MDP2612454.1 carbon-nitrogen hydrolase family protein [Oceanobacter sp. 2_MG-2023]
MTTNTATTLRVATAAYEVGFLASFADWQKKISALVAEAAEDGAKVLLLPEYVSLELTSLFPPAVYQSLKQQLIELQGLRVPFVAEFVRLAKQHQVVIAAGTFPVGLATVAGWEQYVNRCYLCYPSGEVHWQDKLQMTRFEREQWGISAGDELRVFDTPFGRLAINICYDSEFPLFAHQQVAQGADLILVPSCTDTLAGYHRVQLSCRARALENQCFVLQSPTVGEAAWSPAIDVNYGAAGIYSPVDYGFPDDGIITRLATNQPGWCYADLDLAELAHVRKAGQVFNYRDWDGQYPFVTPPLADKPTE